MGGNGGKAGTSKASASAMNEFIDGLEVEDPTVGLDCHQTTDKLHNEFGDAPNVTYYHWEDTKSPNLYGSPTDKDNPGGPPLSDWPFDKMTSEAGNDWLHSLVWTNGHSFVKVGNTFVDGNARSLGVPQRDINIVDRWLSKKDLWEKK